MSGFHAKKKISKGASMKAGGKEWENEEEEEKEEVRSGLSDRLCPFFLLVFAECVVKCRHGFMA